MPPVPARDVEDATARWRRQFLFEERDLGFGH
jgi:hypothetical protein